MIEQYFKVYSCDFSREQNPELRLKFMQKKRREVTVKTFVFEVGSNVRKFRNETSSFRIFSRFIGTQYTVYRIQTADFQMRIVWRILDRNFSLKFTNGLMNNGIQK